MMGNKSKIPIIRKTLRKGKKSNIFSGEVIADKVKFRYEIYGVTYGNVFEDILLNVRVYNCEFRHWVSSQWKEKGVWGENVETINKYVRYELEKEWGLFFTSTFNLSGYDFGIGTIKHIKQP